jgi:hypothetical protein
MLLGQLIIVDLQPRATKLVLTSLSKPMLVHERTSIFN